MIDMHIHAVPPNLPGVGPLSPALRGTVENVARIVREQMHNSGMTHVLSMGAFSDSIEDPLGVERTWEICNLVRGMHAIGIANPQKSDPDFLRAVEKQLATHRIIALKGFLGYLHYPPAHPGYEPYYRLAAKYRIPFIFHTGDTYSPYAKLKYAQPLGVDEVAVDHPDVSFVMAHIGNPWVVEAAEVVYKNMNVWVDLSGLLVGESIRLDDPENQDTLHDVRERIQLAFRYAERPNRFLYGTDWPLAPMAEYRRFIESALPVEYHDSIFSDTARRLFRIEE
jgi:uncharacterized protein